MEEPYIFNIYSETRIVAVVLTAIVVIFLVVIIILLLFGSFTFSPHPNPPPPVDHFPQLTWDVGASTGGPVSYNNAINFGNQSTCTAGANTTWNNDKCECTPNFYGANCILPIFSSSYYAVGQAPVGATAQLTVLKQQAVNSVSFDPQHNDATTICDQTPGCIGFSITNGKAPLQATFFSNLTVPGNGHIPYNLAAPPLYYMKLTSEPTFPDRVFLGKGKMPLRYWILDRYENPDTNIISVSKDTVYELDFFPDTPINNAGNLTGLLSDNSFQYTDIPTLIANTPSTMIKFSGDNLPQIPLGWTLPVYIAFH